MGNKQGSKTAFHVLNPSTSEPGRANSHDSIYIELAQIYERLTSSSRNNDRQVQITDFEEIFNGINQFSSYLFDIFKCEKLAGNLPEKNHFINFFRPFFDQDVKQIIKYFLIFDVELSENERISKLIECCSAASRVRLNNTSDEQILASFIQNVVLQSNNGGAIDMELCVANTCSQMVVQLNQFIIKSLRNNGIKEVCLCMQNEMPLQSMSLSPFVLWLLLSQIPQVYYSRRSSSAPSSSKTDETVINTPFSWALLFDTFRDGLSMTRFESKVLGYQSPTVSIVEFNDQGSFVLGVDTPWQMSPQNWGGSNCFLINLKPAFKKLAAGSNLIFFNTKLRSLDNGIIVGNSKDPLLKINGDFDNLHHMEVWGCGRDSALNAQQDQKKWEKRQAEKHGKVALPGKWEENPDKAILDMADKKIFVQQ